MKKVKLLAFFIFLAGLSYGQYSFDLGLKVGLNNSRITVNQSDYTSENIVNYHFGAFARVNLNRIYFQPEVYYSSKGGNIEGIFESPVETLSEFNYDVIDVPVLAGFNIINKTAFKIRVMGGPVFSFLTNSSVDSNDSRFSADYFKDHFFGWQYGLGADFLFLTFDARIENSFGDIYSSSSLDSKNKTLLLTLGIKIL